MVDPVVVSQARIRAPRIGLRCDAGARSGTGHLIRCLALAEALISQGAEVLLLGDVDGIGWAEAEVDRRGLRRWPGPQTPGECVRVARHLALDAMVIDSYELDPGCAGALRDAGIPVLAIVDTDTRGQIADIYVDQNLGAEDLPVALPPGAVRLAGLRYALLRRAVRELRPAAPRTAGGWGTPAEASVSASTVGVGAVPRVLCFFGGSDAYDAAPTVTRLLLATGVAVDATVIAARPSIAAELAALAVGPGQSVTVIEPTSDLPALITRSDLVIGASGTSTWELLCLGAVAALVWVVENQLIGFTQVVQRGLAAGLGRLDDLVPGGNGVDQAVRTLHTLLTSVTERDALARKAWTEVDGEGSRRVASMLLELVDGVTEITHDEHPTFTRWP